MEIFKVFGTVFLKGGDKTEKELGGIDKKAKSLGSRFGSAAGKIAKAGLVMGAAVAGVAVVLVGKGVKAAVAFEEQMATVATLLDGDVKKRIGELGDNIKKLSIKTGTPLATLTDGLYQVVSAFGDTAESAEILEIAAKGAAAGGATVAATVDLLSGITKGYGDTSLEANKKASDLAFTTAKLGQTTIPELAASMGKVVPLASAMKISQEELFGAMATLTGVTGNTAEVSTQLRATFQSFMKPSKEMAAVLGKLGYATGAEALESLGLQGTLEELKKEVNGDEIAFANLFSSVEAGNAVLALAGAQSENFTEKTQAMADAAGATETAFTIQQATNAATWDRIKASWEVIKVTLGEKLLPELAKLAKWVEDNMPEIMQFFDDLTDWLAYEWELTFKYVGPYLQWEWEENIYPYLKLLKEWLDYEWELNLKYIGPWLEWEWEELVRKFEILKGYIDDLKKIKEMFEYVTTGKLPGENKYESGKTGYEHTEDEGMFDPVIGGVLDKIGGASDVLNDFSKNAGEAVIDFGDKALDWAGSQFPFNLLPGGVKGQFPFNLIPGMAAGGTVGRSGFAMVGENGPELLNLPRGATVTPNGQGVTINIIEPHLFNENDGQRLAELIYSTWSAGGVGRAR